MEFLPSSAMIRLVAQGLKPMLDADLFVARPTLTSPGPLLTALYRFGAEASSTADLWHQLTENYIVDLDAVAALLPRAESGSVLPQSGD
jgi:hypothetical protein